MLLLLLFCFVFGFVCFLFFVFCFACLLSMSQGRHCVQKERKMYMLAVHNSVSTAVENSKLSSNEDKTLLKREVIQARGMDFSGTAGFTCPCQSFWGRIIFYKQLCWNTSSHLPATSMPGSLPPSLFHPLPCAPLHLFSPPFNLHKLFLPSPPSLPPLRPTILHPPLSPGQRYHQIPQKKLRC